MPTVGLGIVLLLVILADDIEGSIQSKPGGRLLHFFALFRAWPDDDRPDMGTRRGRHAARYGLAAGAVTVFAERGWLRRAHFVAVRSKATGSFNEAISPG